MHCVGIVGKYWELGFTNKKQQQQPRRTRTIFQTPVYNITRHFTHHRHKTSCLLQTPISAYYIVHTLLHVHLLLSSTVHKNACTPFTRKSLQEFVVVFA